MTLLIITVLSLLSLGGLLPLLRDPYRRVPAPEPLYSEVPTATFDATGLV